jgi:predicted DNA-binding transcriptional regulator AlpA
MFTDTIDRDQPQTSAATYKNAKQVRVRYDGISDMTLWRWLHDEELGFPKPIWIQGRRFWKESELVSWERTRPVGKVERQALLDARLGLTRQSHQSSPSRRAAGGTASSPGGSLSR